MTVCVQDASETPDGVLNEIIFKAKCKNSIDTIGCMSCP